MSWFSRLRNTFRARRVSDEMEREMRFHLTERAGDLEAHGLTPREARLEARRRFGSLAPRNEHARDRDIVAFLETVSIDFRYAVRALRATPGLNIVIVLTIALGIGANAALFTMMRFTSQPPPGITADDALVRIRSAAGPVSYPELQGYAAESDIFTDVAGSTAAFVSFDLANGDGRGGGWASFVSRNFFSLLNVTPALGPGFAVSVSDDRTPEPVAVMSHVLWERGFGSDPAIIGRAFRVNDVDVRIVGVAPKRFVGASTGASTYLWMPIGAFPSVTARDPSVFDSMDDALFSVFARLRPGVSVRQATSAVAVIASRFPSREAFTDAPPAAARSAEVVPLYGKNRSRHEEAEWLTIGAALGAVTLLILLITCTNVSALLVGAAMARRKEIAVRLSLGAPRGRIIRQLLTESVILAFVAGAAGLGLLAGIVKLIATRLPPDIELTVHWPSVVFTAIFAVGTAMLFGLSPALHATRLRVVDILKSAAPGGSRSRSRLQRSFVIAQIALTQPILVALGALVGVIIQSVAWGGDSSGHDRIVAVRFAGGVRAGGADISRARADTAMFSARLLDLPGVVAVAGDFGGGHGIADFVAPSSEGRTSTQPFRARLDLLAPGYFTVMDIRVVAGRTFTVEDADSRANIAIIGGDLAKELWGPENPIGKRLTRLNTDGTEAPDTVIVGVVDPARAGTRTAEGLRKVFTPAMHAPAGQLLVRTAGPAEPLLPAIRGLARAVAPDIPFFAETLASRDEKQRAEIVEMGGAAALGGVLALLLGSIGLYAAISFSVGQRTREIGIRVALGARRPNVIGMFLGDGLRLSTIGLALGLPLSLLALGVFESQQGHGFVSLPVLTLAIAALVLGIGAVAAFVPARRAASVDPLLTLRAE